MTATVSILNIDPADEGNVPQSFTVVSSLLQETYWGHQQPASKAAAGRGDVNIGLLPDYDFRAYMMYEPASVPDDDEAAHLLGTFLSGDFGRYIMIDRVNLRNAHEHRKGAPPGVSPDDPAYRYGQFTLFACYAVAALACCGDGTGAAAAPNRAMKLYAAALRQARMCKSNNPLWRIAALGMCAVFQSRTDVDHGLHYDMVMRAMKLSIETGLHNGRGFDKMTLYEQEMAKRLFWAVYNSERVYAIATGRQFVLDESMVEVDFPVDLEDHELRDDNKILAARKITDWSSQPPTTLSFMLHLLELRRIESRLVTDIYDQSLPIEERFAYVDSYLKQLDAWKDYPRVMANCTVKQSRIVSAAYARAIRVLLQPFLGHISPHSELFRKCIVETGALCRAFRDYFRVTRNDFSTMSMHSCFVAGLTLVYCLWLSKDAPILHILEGVRACTAALYVLTERSQLCRNYRETFENLVTATMKHIIDYRLEKFGDVHERLRREDAQLRARKSHSVSSSNVVSPAASTSSSTHTVPLFPVEQTVTESKLVNAGPVGHNTSMHPPTSAPIHSSPSQHQPPSTSLPPPPLPPPPPAPAQAQAPQPQPQPPLSQLPQQEPPSVRTGDAYPFPSGRGSISGTSGGPDQAGIGTQASKDWIETYGYDDSLFNMINDIALWSKQVGDPDPTQEQELPQEQWTSITDFGYTW